MSTPGTELAAGVSPRARSCWVAAYALLLLVLAWVPVTWAGVLIVVGSTVVPFWVAGPPLLIAGTVVLVSLRVFRVPRPRVRTRWSWVFVVVTVLAWVAVPMVAAWYVIGKPSYVVVRPTGSDGCRAVVEETSFLLAGSGTVHVAGGWGPFAPQVGSYTTDDGYRPASTGSYSASWDDGTGGVLDIDGAMADGQSLDAGDDPGLVGFDC